MNKIYKVIWSHVKQCYVVTSELVKAHGRTSTRGRTSRLAVAALTAFILTAGVTSVGLADNNDNIITNTDTKISDINANITGKGNKVTDSSNAEIVGDNNTVTNEAKGEDGSVRYVRSNDARIHGSGNTISASRNQQVIGDNNTIMGRDDGTVTDYQHPEGREPNVSDLTIGRGNFIRSTDTYRNEWDSLKVIGNNNRADFKIESAGGPAAGIVIGDNQNIDGIKDSIVIGSLSPSEQQLSPSGQPKEKGEIDDLYSVGANSIIIGYHTKIKQYGEGIVVGNRSQGIGIYETIMGSRSIIGSDTSDLDSGSGALASIYGAFNKIEDADSPAESAADVDGVGNSINGSLNITSSARGTMIMGVGNTVTHSKGPDILGKDEDTPGATGYWVSSGLYGASYYAQGADTVAEGNNLNISYDEMRNSWQKYMETSGGAVSVLGNSNNADYAIRSQILGTGNTLQGSETDMSAYNTVSGFANTGTNIKRSAIVGTGNTLENGEDNVVIGDYHNLENGKHNVILGSMDSTEKQVTKQSKSAWAKTYEHPDGTFEYTVTEQVPVKEHKNDIENAVMVGYNTDVTQNGGVALGSDSIASTEAGKTGYDAKGKTHAASDKDYATWVSTDAAVSVGRAEEKDEKTGEVTSKAITRQITNLAAGTQDTDAVNVAQLKAISNTVDASKTKYYSVRDMPYQLGTYAAYTNEKNDGAKEMGALAAGYMTYAGGIASTVTGSLSGVINRAAAPGSQDFRGATALSYGTFNINNNTIQSGPHSGVANSIVGQANMTTDSNAALIYGAGNVISNSYRDIDISKMGAITSNLKDPKALGEALQAAVPTSGGQVMAFGGGNVVDNAYMTQVIGVGNTVKGNQKKNDDGTADDTSSQLNYVDGFYTKLINGKNDYLIGAHNTVTGDSVEKNHSNIVIGDNHTLENQSNNIILGSADSALLTTASQVTILGHNANATVEGGVALGYGSIADREAGKAGLDMSIVTNGKVGDFSKDTSPVWKSNAAAVSVGNIVKDSEGKLTADAITRQITGVAAGREDYDAVNVAQLRAVMNLPVHIYNGGKFANNVYKGGDQIATDMTISNLQFDFGDGLLAQEVGNEGDKRVLVTLDKDALKDDPDFKGPKGDPGDQGPKGDKGDTGAPGKDGKDGKDGGVGTVVGDEMNITVANTETDPAKPANYKVSLNKEITVDKVTAGNTTISSDGLTITGGPSITKSGIDAGGKKVTHVADGEIAADSKDAVNGSQLYRVQKNVESIENNVTNLAGDVTNLNGRVSDLDNRVNKVGAGAAALAALHPLDFNPDDKWNFAVGYGNYRNANSVAVGAFYQPNENTMFNVATNFGNGENMINAGVSFKIGKGNSYAGISKAQLVAENQQLKENDALQDQKIQKQDQEIQELKKALEELKSRIK